MSNESSRVQSGLTKQVDDVLTADTDWITLANELDVSRYTRDAHPEWSSSLPFRPMFLAYLWATVERESLSGIPERLSDRPELARAFGFEMDDLPSESSCKPVRLESRFRKLQTVVESGAEEIRLLAAERGAPIGNDLLKTADDEDKQSLSNRTVQRLLRKKGHQVLDELKSVAIPSISLSRPDDAIYDDDELLVLEAIASIKQKAAHDSGQKLGDMKIQTQILMTRSTRTAHLVRRCWKPSSRCLSRRLRLY